MFMAMEAREQAEKRDMVCGLILQKISINTVSCGVMIRSCKKVKISQNTFFLGHYFHKYHCRVFVCWNQFANLFCLVPAEIIFILCISHLFVQLGYYYNTSGIIKYVHYRFFNFWYDVLLQLLSMLSLLGTFCSSAFKNECIYVFFSYSRYMNLL